jgi:hypothetical protein
MSDAGRQLKQCKRCRQNNLKYVQNHQCEHGHYKSGCKYCGNKCEHGQSTIRPCKQCHRGYCAHDKLLQDNCVECHRGFCLHNILLTKNCTDCNRFVRPRYKIYHCEYAYRLRWTENGKRYEIQRCFKKGNAEKAYAEIEKFIADKFN